MQEKIQNSLEEEIEERIKELGALEVGTDKYTDAVESISKLYSLRSTESKIDADYSQKIEELEKEETLKQREFDLKEQEMAQNKKLAVAGNIVQVGCVAIPLAVYAVLYDKGLKFEETGTIASSMVRNLIQKFKFTK